MNLDRTINVDFAGILGLPPLPIVDVERPPPEYSYGIIHCRMEDEPPGSESWRIVRYLPGDDQTPHREIACVAACPSFEAALAAGSLMTGVSRMGAG